MLPSSNAGTMNCEGQTISESLAEWPSAVTPQRNQHLECFASHELFEYVHTVDINSYKHVYIYK